MSFTITENCEQELLNIIEIYIKDHIDFDVPKIYFSGEYDSNQTKFERQSNQLEIGVLASNKSSGLIMLRLLRIIIDVRPDMLLEDALGLDNKNEQVALGSNLSIEKIMKNLSVCEKTYSNNYIHSHFKSVKSQKNSIKNGNTNYKRIQISCIGANIMYRYKYHV